MAPNKLTAKTLDRLQRKGELAASQTTPSLSAWRNAAAAAADSDDETDEQELRQATASDARAMADAQARTATGDWDAVVQNARTTLAGTRPGPRKQVLEQLRVQAAKRELESSNSMRRSELRH